MKVKGSVIDMIVEWDRKVGRGTGGMTHNSPTGGSRTGDHCIAMPTWDVLLTTQPTVHPQLYVFPYIIPCSVGVVSIVCV